MRAQLPADWYEANQHYLMASLDAVRESLERHVAASPESPVETEPPPIPDDMPAPPALVMLCELFGLSPFERDVLLLCAGMELDAAFASLCAAAQGDPPRNYPTFSLALAALPNPHWSALTPSAALRYWRLIEIGTGHALTLSPLRIDERILHYLAGVQHLDARLVGVTEPVGDPGDLVSSQRESAARIAGVWAGREANLLPLPPIQLCDGDWVSKRDIAAAACAILGLEMSAISAALIPTALGELDALLRLWEREAILSRRVLLLDCHEVAENEPAREAALNRMIERLSIPLIIATRERRRTRRSLLTFEVSKPSAAEQRHIWEEVLGRGSGLNGRVEAIVTQFNLSAPAIRAVGTLAMGEADSEGDTLWDACRTQARPRLDDLAQRITPIATWDDLVIPDFQREVLHEIALHVRQRATVYEKWGFAARSERGLGISALFAGASGTGKTMAAEVLANELRLDLYRIDLSSVVSKYIGETEKNLRRVFDAAEEGGAILLFDEADALFGKRSEVKDSHDRYANVEISYLLQRMESYRGLAILTTNMKSAIDAAFMRRIRFVVQFPFPDAGQRIEIWRRIFPPQTPVEGLDVEKLARLNVAGGNIRNIALNAAFLAAEAGEPVRMAHLLRAAQGEYAKLEKTLTGAEIGGWV